MQLSKRVFFFLLFIGVSFTSYGQTKPDDLLKKFFSEYEFQPARAVENLYSSNVWMSRAKDGVEQMKNEVNKYTVDYVGKYYGNELITKKQFS
jgi:hypothetical protein